MIKNERQLQISKKNLKSFETAIKIIQESQNDPNELLTQIQINSIQSQIDLFNKEINDYEKIKSGEIKTIITDYFNLSDGIINARIAKGYSHQEFGKKLGVSEQQIQKYEADNYSNTSLKRLQEIIYVLDINVQSTFSFSKKKEFQFLGSDNLNINSIKTKIKNRGTTVAICQ